MNLTTTRYRVAIGILAPICLLLLVFPGVVRAERVVDASEPVVVSNDITNDTVSVESAASGNRSGLGDGTNPGEGDGTDKSPNSGSDNPNQSDSSGAGGKKSPK
jgi:hypothetical protein